jgi:hypothetical protein
MMRASLAMLALLLGVATSTLGAIALAAPVGAASAGTRLAAGAARRTDLAVSPAPDDLALIELRFHGPAHRRLSGATLRVAVRGLFGDDYLASAAPPLGSRGIPRALVLVVDRPSPLAQPAKVALHADSLRRLGAPVVAVALDPFTRPRGAMRRLCDVPRSGASLSSATLHALGSRGQPLAGFTTTSAVAEAYDVVCALPYASAFAEVVKQAPAAPVQPPSEPSPPPGPPGCTPCPPRPGIACPLALEPDICVAALAPGTRPAAAGAY